MDQFICLIFNCVPDRINVLNFACKLNYCRLPVTWSDLLNAQYGWEYFLLQAATAAAGTETNDAGSAVKNKVTIITAVAKRKELSIETKKGELMESNMDAMEVQHLCVCVCVCVCVNMCMLSCSNMFALSCEVFVWWWFLNRANTVKNQILLTAGQ